MPDLFVPNLLFTSAPRKEGNKWCVELGWPNGNLEHVLDFDSDVDAKAWVKDNSSAWLRKRLVSYPIAYPQTERRKWDNIVTIRSRSLRPSAHWIYANAVAQRHPRTAVQLAVLKRGTGAKICIPTRSV